MIFYNRWHLVRGIQAEKSNRGCNIDDSGGDKELSSGDNVRCEMSEVKNQWKQYFV